MPTKSIIRMFFWNINKIVISKLDIELVATEEEKSDDAQDLRNIDATEERQKHHWIDIKKTCTALSNSQI